jgi:hypothetical protein
MTSLCKADTSIQSLDGYATEEYVTNNAVSKSGDNIATTKAVAEYVADQIIVSYTEPLYRKEKFG